MKKLLKYLIKHFHNNTCSVVLDNTKYCTGTYATLYKAYIDNGVLGEYSWSPQFNTIAELDTYCRDKVEKHLKNVQVLQKDKQ